MKFVKKIASIAMTMVFYASILEMQHLTVNAITYSDDMKYGDYLYYEQVDEDDDGTYDYIEITDCDESAAEVVILSEIDGLPIKSIGDKAFYDCKRLISIELPDSVTSIGFDAFYGCYNLESIEIPQNVTSIGSDAFSCCMGLVSVNIPDSVISIGDNAFYYCTSLTSVEVSENNDYYCSINGILFNKEKTELIKYPIGNTRTSYTIPNGVTSIVDYAFEWCESLTSVVIPESVVSIGYRAFSLCTSLKSVEIPESVTSIGCLAFADCSSLTSIEIPSSVTAIEESAFEGCENLESVTIYNNECEIYDNQYTISDTAVIYGYSGSTAQAYAEKYNREFVSLGVLFVLGDANGDGKITALDASTIAKLLAQAGISGETITVEDYPTMDYNGDGKITALDASAIAKYLAEKALQS